jgi:hypothetical protein
MIYIAHRGNTIGKFESYENEPNYIDKAISEGFDVEIDVWYVDSIWYLGHDKPQYGIDFDWIRKRSDKLWVHCKNIEALERLSNTSKLDTADINFFWHEEDTATLTSYNYIWVYPGKQPIKGSIAVMPEINNDDVSKCMGICSDVIKKYKDENTQA